MPSPIKILIRKDAIWFTAFLENQPKIQAKSSISADASVGRLIRENPAIFDTAIDFDRDHAQTQTHLKGPLTKNDPFR
ncbi:hypothetical protein COT97_01695 [Candidatus Falkowbacteria bacterium CG10_big_fil_rev_8_21_14_0_10_39_11]|uniref:Uncharacterized protein n=1 Tax=Candidatus Falkowbacteria bacterium CG10_big_fil_rev_8_21_14_0_10_39_11 TaxID=1974565 RepID=A0A2H0V5Q9_9BACT|nr:MAG: hypothetical protein COT97_01695 [Candidatus Falkowbacteria bacterium CG10_big_fil_rev_8_21_14_0_10_39_11]